MNKLKTSRYSIALLLTLAGSVMFVSYFYGKILVSPNDYMFSASGDGMKNYYTYAYHIKHDSSLIEFCGMNYPYGEHFMYTDCHPVLTLILRGVSKVFPGIVNYSIGIVNFLMIISFILTSFFLFLLFKELKVRPYLAAVGAFGIMILAPQVFRMTGHLSLSYSFFIPLTILLTLKSYKHFRSAGWIILQAVNIIFWFFIHAYLGMMAVFFVLAFWLIHFSIHFKSYFRNIYNYQRLILWVVFPVVFFLVFVNLTDILEGRTPNPSGFFLHNAEPDDVFLPHHPPLRPVIDSFVYVNLKWEAWSYIGLASVFILLFVTGNAFKRLIKEKRFSVKPVEKEFAKNRGCKYVDTHCITYDISCEPLFYGYNDKYLPKGNFRIVIWASVILLIFAFGFPFKLFPALLDWLPQVKQFRATGRFAWFFFFAITMMAVVVSDNLLKIYHKRSFLVVSLIFAGLIFNVVEGVPYHLENKNQISQSKNLFVLENNDEAFREVVSSIDYSKYQAILPMPFYYNGSENFTIPSRGNTVRESMVFSYFSGLPVMGSYLTRTGIGESKEIVQMISPDWYPKLMKRDRLQDKPFLIVRPEGTLNEYEEMALAKSTWIGKYNTTRLYEIDVNDLFSNSAEKVIREFVSIKDSLKYNNGFYFQERTGFIHFENFESLESNLSFNGLSAFKGNKKDHLIVVEFGQGTFETGKTYTASMWMYNGQLDALNFYFRLRVEEYDPRNDSWNLTQTLPEQSQVIFGDWSMIEFDFTVLDSQNYVSLKSIGKPIDKQVFYLDDLLIREKGADIYRIDKETNGEVTGLFKNNHRIILPGD
ncbi:MAG: hypothetical protein K8S16_07980 [Bacteroidales bacterium]|nr:hypothetical protein [Bacteroidales bacterium]